MITLDAIDILVELANEPLCIAWLDDIVRMEDCDAESRIMYYRFLYHLVMTIMPGVTVELGVQFGYASAHMAVAAKKHNGCVIGIDHIAYHIPMNVIRAHCDNYAYHIADTVRGVGHVRSWCKVHGPVGLVFQDSSHHYAHSVREWETYMPLMTRGGVWVCDDITDDFKEPGVDEYSMAEYFDRLPGTKRLYPGLYPDGTNNCVGVVIV